MKKLDYYGVFGAEVWPGLVTPDKQLHGGPGPIMNEGFFWSWVADFINWLERQCPDDTFTIVVDKFSAFNNDYWARRRGEELEDEEFEGGMRP